MNVTVVGPAPPPNGGMAMQTKQLVALLKASNVNVDHLVTNRDYRPAFIAKLPVIRAFFRLFDYWLMLNRCLKKYQVVHLMANSGWSFYLFAMPVIHLAKRHQIPVIMNYRGGLADSFFSKHWRWIKKTMADVEQVIVPSSFLQDVFKQRGIDATIMPNIVDLGLFEYQLPTLDKQKLHVVITRNLEEIYDVKTAIDGFALFAKDYPNATLSVAGSGPQLAMLKAHVSDLDLSHCITFVGRLERSQVAKLYHQADILLNTSLVDNTPNSLIEAMACGVVVLSSNVGGIPHLVEHQRHGYLFKPQCPAAVAKYLALAVELPQQSHTMAKQGQQLVAGFSPANVVPTLIHLYQRVANNA